MSTCGSICFPLPPKGFASLEAKRIFRVPRSTSKHLNPKNENSSTAEQVTEEAGACETDCSPTSLFDDFRYLGNATPPEGYVRFLKELLHFNWYYSVLGISFLCFYKLDLSFRFTLVMGQNLLKGVNLEVTVSILSLIRMQRSSNKLIITCMPINN